MKTSHLLAIIAPFCSNLLGCVTQDEALPDDQVGGKADEDRNESLLLSCSAQYTFVSGNSSFRWEPQASGTDPEIQISLQKEHSTGIDTFRRFEADTDAFHYSVALELDRTSARGHSLSYSIVSKKTGDRIEASGYPSPFAFHGQVLDLTARAGESFGTTTDANNEPAPIVAARILCRISDNQQNTNLETSYPTLKTVP
jgi:hypothetical protein